MSLDVTLRIPGEDTDLEDFNSFEVRHLATNFAIICQKGYRGSYESWFNHITPTWREIANRDNPDYEKPTEEVYSANITHNLGEMATEAGIYEALWRPHRLREGYNIPEDDNDAEWDFEESCTIKAKELIDKLEKGLAELKAKPEHYKKFDSPNGWGLYVNFVPFVEEYLNACKEYPEAEVSVWR